jgi:hypothetical protein
LTGPRTDPGGASSGAKPGSVPPSSGSGPQPKRGLTHGETIPPPAPAVKSARPRILWNTTPGVRGKDLGFLDIAAETRRPIILFFHARSTRQGEKDERRLESAVFSVPKIVDLAAGFHAVKLDIQKTDREVLGRYRAAGLAAVLVLDCEGTEIARFNALARAEPVYQAMRRAEEKSAKLEIKSPRRR